MSATTEQPTEQRHQPWCDVESHEDYAATYDPSARCTGHVRATLLDRSHRVAGFVEDTSAGPVVRLADAPLHKALTPDAAVRMANLIQDLADIAAGGAR